MIEVPVVSYNDFRQAYADALVIWIQDQPDHNAQNILTHGIPKLDTNDPKPFIKWAFLQLEPDLPERYFLETHDGFWAISLDNCICWKAK
jgi:hypothetical protein